MFKSSSNDSSSDNNRIGHQCWYREYHYPNWRPWRRGILRAWSTDHDEYENGPGPYPAGVVEDVETAGMRNVHVARITFAANKPDDELKIAP